MNRQQSTSISGKHHPENHKGEGSARLCGVVRARLVDSASGATYSTRCLGNLTRDTYCGADIREVRLSAAALNRIAIIVALAVAGMLCAPVTAQAQRPLDKVSFGTNWVAEGEHGGHYQALVDGTYRRYGLDVTIVPGGPNVNNRLLLPVGKLDFFMSANTLQSFDAVEQNIPTLAVAAMFQKEPQVLMAHPGEGIDKFEDLKNLTLFISREGLASYFQWLKADFGFSEARVKPYTSNAQPFLADKRSAMQGYVTSEPYAIEKQAHFKPKVFLIADQGFNSYSTLIETRRELVEKRADLVQRFVDASIIGWANYLYGDNKAANALIKKQNPEMTDELLAYSLAKMKEYGIVDSGDTATLGIGAMTDTRMRSFFDKMVRAGVVKPSLALDRAYTLQFVNKKVGLDLRPK
jgi:NitT/TauT family transport system substrate-binding protein